MQQGYYTKRIEELEKRKEEVTAQLVTSKLTLKGINKEIKNCYEYMNSTKYEVRDSNKFEEELLKFEHKVLTLENKVKSLKNTISKKEDTIVKLNEVIQDKEHEIGVLKLKSHNDNLKLQEEIAELNIKLNDNKNLKMEKYVNEIKSHKKENRRLKLDNKALHERIEMMDNTIQNKNNEIRILHERLNWQPVKPQNNIFEELLEGK